MIRKSGSHPGLVLCLTTGRGAGGGVSFLLVPCLCCQSFCKYKEIWTYMPPTFLTQNVTHYIRSLLFAFFFFFCLTVYSGSLVLSEHWRQPFLFPAVYYFTAGMSVDYPALYRRTCGFQTSAITNDAAVNNRVRTSSHTCADASGG